MANKQWIVFHSNGMRVGSVPKTKLNILKIELEMKKQFCIELIQTDINGTLHYNVLGRREKI